MEKRQNSDARSRHGSVAIEYAITLIVIVAALGALVFMQTTVLAPFQTADRLFAADSGVRKPTIQSLTDDPSANAQDRMLFASMVGLAMLGVLTLVCVRTVTRKPIATDPADCEQDGSAPEIVFDPQAELRNMLYNKRTMLLSQMTRDLRNVFEGEFEVKHLMSTKMKTCDTETPADEIRERMSKNNMHHLLVCEGTKLVGVISDRDLSKRYATRAFELMTRNPISVSPTSLLIPTISTMINKRISCLPVTEGDQLKGVLTRLDMLVAFQCLLQAMSKLSISNESDDNPVQAS